MLNEFRQPAFCQTDVVGSTSEVWLPIKGYEDLYEVSNLCNVKSLAKKIQRGKYNAWRNLPEKILSISFGSVTLVKDKRKKTFDVQTLHKIAFDGFKPDGKRKVNLLKVNDEIKVVKRRQVCQIVKSKLEKRSCKSVGVSKRKDKFIPRISINQIDIHLGTFETEKDAYNIYNLACKNEHLYTGDAKDFRKKLYAISV